VVIAVNLDSGEGQNDGSCTRLSMISF